MYRSRNIWAALAVPAWVAALVLLGADLGGWQPRVPWLLIAWLAAGTLTVIAVVVEVGNRITAARPAADSTLPAEPIRWVIPPQRQPLGTTYTSSAAPMLTTVNGPTLRVVERQHATVQTHKVVDDVPEGAAAQIFELGRRVGRRDATGQ